MTSPSSSRTTRRTPWVEGCWGPMLRIISSVGELPAGKDLHVEATAPDHRGDLGTLERLLLPDVHPPVILAEGTSDHGPSGERLGRGDRLPDDGRRRPPEGPLGGCAPALRTRAEGRRLARSSAPEADDRRGARGGSGGRGEGRGAAARARSSWRGRSGERRMPPRGWCRSSTRPGSSCTRTWGARRCPSAQRGQRRAPPATTRTSRSIGERAVAASADATPRSCSPRSPGRKRRWWSTTAPRRCCSRWPHSPRGNRSSSLAGS